MTDELNKKSDDGRENRTMDGKPGKGSDRDQRPYNIIRPKTPNQNRPNNVRQQQQGKHMNDDDPNSQIQHTQANKHTQMQIQIHMYKQKASRYANANKTAGTTMRRICTNHANLQLTHTCIIRVLYLSP